MTINSQKVLLQCIKVPATQTETVKRELLSQGLFQKGYKLLKEGQYVYLPISSSTSSLPKWDVFEKSFEPLEKKIDTHSSLASILPIQLHKFIPTSFDRVGECILIKLDPKILDYKHAIGKALLHEYTVRSVFTKSGDVETDFRTINWECIAGEDNPIVVNKMHGLRWKINISKVYFNARLSNEYLRIASLCTNSDVVIDMFAGIGPFVLLCAVKSKATIYALDINPMAIELLHENIQLNLKHLQGTIKPMCGDSRELIKILPKASIIIMNLPGLAIDFLDSAMVHLHNNGVIFLHQFIYLTKEEKKSDFSKHKQILQEKIHQLSREQLVQDCIWDIQVSKLRDVSPGKVHVVWDIRKVARNVS